MNDVLLSDLKCALNKCSDCILHPEYISLLNKLCHINLSHELIDYLCNIVTSKEHIWEIRLKHLRVLLLNPSASAFDLKKFYFENLKKCQRLAMKIFFIRGYAIYASEEELNIVMDKFCKSLEKNHDYINYNYILSIAGLPYLVDKYGYVCFVRALEKAEEEHKKIDPLLRGYFTLNENFECVNLLPIEKAHKKTQQFLEKHRNTL